MTSAGGAAPLELAPDVMLGRCDPLRAEVYVRVSPPPGVDAAGAVLSGTLTGPECSRAITLPGTVRLVPVPAAGPGGATSILARAVLAEPAPWTPELPNLYRLDARLVASGREVGSWRGRVGLRRLGVRGRSFWLDGRRFVPRGVAGTADTIDLEAARAAGLAAGVADPPESFLDRADATGLAILAVLQDAAGAPLDAAAAVARIVRWARHPAVLLVVVPSAVSAADARAIAAGAHGRRGTLLLARGVAGTDPPPGPWPAADGIVDGVVVELPPGGLPVAAWATAPPPGPLLAWRPGEQVDQELFSRRDCDRLQADLAAWAAVEQRQARPWDWAGYMTG